MNRFRLITAVAIAGVVSAMPAAAQGKSGSHGGGATTHAGPATTPTGNTTHGKPADAGTHGPSANAGTHAKTAEQHRRPRPRPACRRHHECPPHAFADAQRNG
jgi:hypothetical protein